MGLGCPQEGPQPVRGGVGGAECLELDGRGQEPSARCPVLRWGLAAVPVLGAGAALAPPPAALGCWGALVLPPGVAPALGPVRLCRRCPTPLSPAPLRVLDPGLLLRSLCCGTLPWHVATSHPQPQERRWPWGGPEAGEGRAPGFGVGLAGGRQRRCWPQPGFGAGTGVGGQRAWGSREARGLPGGVREMKHSPQRTRCLLTSVPAPGSMAWVLVPQWQHIWHRCDGQSMLAQWRGCRARGWAVPVPRERLLPLR